MREIIASIKKEDAKEYKELWVPGFHIEGKNTELAQNFLGGTINGKTFVNVSTRVE